MAIRGAVGTLADYFEQQGPRESDIVWAGTGGDRPGTGFGAARPATVGFDKSDNPLSAAAGQRHSRNTKKKKRRGVRSRTAPSNHDADFFEFTSKQCCCGF